MNTGNANTGGRVSEPPYPAHPAHPAYSVLHCISPAFLKWFNARLPSGLMFPPDFLPETGLTVVSGDGRDLFSAAVYMDMTSSVAYAGWMAANPANTPRETYEAARLLISCLEDYAKKYGIEHLMTVSGNRAINLLYEQAGFKAGDQTVQHMYKKINPAC